jgi:LemA protein
MVIGWIIGIVILVLLIVFISYYNRFGILQNRIENSLSQIDVQLKRRSDLIPNLLETVKGYAKHEKSIMKEVSEARKALVSAKGIDKKLRANAVLESALGRLFAIAENYPTLKANENFSELQKELSSTEDRVAYARQNYNDSVMSYNNVCNFPRFNVCKNI